MFGNLLENSTYLGLMALNTTVGYEYRVPSSDGGSPNIFVIDSFTNYPAMTRRETRGVIPFYFVNASELTAFESNSMMRIPKEITCQEITTRTSRSLMVKNPFIF